LPQTDARSSAREGVSRLCPTRPARRASIGSLVEFAREHDCVIIAEGIQSEQQRDALAECGVPLGQGFYLSRPVPMARALAKTTTR
jgi:EAL domain-containing protein (putative c-di-GMP-specific phosphodiesterase class I)